MAAQGTPQGGQPQGQAAQPQAFSMPEQFANKGPEDIARAYVELEKQYGARADYDQLKQRSEQFDSVSKQYQDAQAALQAWEPWRPYLEATGWDSAKLANALQAQNGQPQGQQPDLLGQWSSRWAELPADQQLPWFVKDVLVPLGNAWQAQQAQHYAQQFQQGMTQQNNYYAQKEKLLFSMLKAALPDVKWDEIYQAGYKTAEEYSKGIDPFELTAKRMADEKKRLEEWGKREKQLRADWEREQENKRMPSVAGAPRGATGGKKPTNDLERRATAVKLIRDKNPEINY